MESQVSIGDLKTPTDVLNLKRRLSESESNNAIHSYVYFVIPEEALVVGTNKIGRIYIDFKGTIIEAHASVGTAPTGASLICDINKNGSTIWTTTGNRITVAATASTGTQTNFDIPALDVGDYLTIDIDQVGSTVAGGKLVVRLKVERTQS